MQIMHNMPNFTCVFQRYVGTVQGYYKAKLIISHAFERWTQQFAVVIRIAVACIKLRIDIVQCIRDASTLCEEQSVCVGGTTLELYNA
jgi:hypothetical protein